MEKVILQQQVHLGGVNRPQKCEKCGRMFAILRIRKMPEESGEYHYVAYIDDGIEDTPCPYCVQENSAKPGDEVNILPTKTTKANDINGCSGIVEKVFDNKILSVIAIDKEGCKFGPFELTTRDVEKKETL